MKDKLPIIYVGTIYDDVRSASELLYEILSERTPDESISHSRMPSKKEHMDFILTKPYKEWNIVVNEDGFPIGTYYVSYSNEIGIGIYKAHRRKGYGRAIISRIKDDYYGQELYANINPVNQKSINLFTGLGFTHIQNTYKLKV